MYFAIPPYEDDEHVFSWEVLEAAPALVRVHISSNRESLLGGAALQSIAAALRHGALRNLLELVMFGCVVDDGDVRDVLEALEESGCAEQMTLLKFSDCGVSLGGVRALAAHLGKDAFPALKELNLNENHRITDVGVEVLAEALLQTAQTFLTYLSLSEVGMCDAGIAALVPLVQQGRMGRLEHLDICGNGGISDHGIISFAESINTKGLPMLSYFYMGELGKLTSVGIGATAHAVINRCPLLKRFHLLGSGAR